MPGNDKGCPYIGSISVGDLYRLRYSLSWWLGFPTRWARKPRPYDRDLSVNYGHALLKCQHALGALHSHLGSVLA